MGASKIPFYTYVDETGNTGHNLFDEVQPDFFSGALITKGDFDSSHREKVAALAMKAGVEALHGKELGIRRIEIVSGDLLSVLRSSNAHFFMARVEKRYLLAAKIFDSLFDSGENAAVAWHHYNIRPLRLTLAFKLASIVDEETARRFWACILEPKESTSQNMLVEVCEALLAAVDSIPDERSRVIFREGLDWARTHPESIQIRWVAFNLPAPVEFNGLEESARDHVGQLKARFVTVVVSVNLVEVDD